MDLDTITDRSATYAFKWQKYPAERDILPCWVADSEFRCAQPIIDALQQRVSHGVFGYTLPAQFAPANQAVARWCERQYDWHIQQDWLVWTPGVVPAFNAACKAFCQPGDKVIVQVPNYPPLLAAPALNGLQRVDIPTLESDGKWVLDFAALEREAQDPACKLLILCNPMNPVGGVFSEQDLLRIADICTTHGLLLVSDEIHCDLILDEGINHLPASKLDALQDISVTLMAASKTFNIAGLGTSFALIPNPALRNQFRQAMQGIVPWANVMGLEATAAAFTRCDDWYQAQLQYLRANRDYLYEQINQIDGLRMLQPAATFLAWVDARGLNIDDVQAWCEAKGVGPSPGVDFAAPGYFRINFGCPRSMLETIIARLKA
ncbi:MalY/PatB family protein [Bowmanella sp. JS7-9]|uniref:cysteine-S-conjugate beta-lyase n=1 Tax=Pseudobowmanella zhangzhouensis TaxID=1537679 RepID=A0ABW1XJJ1_9ALTE|nr:PatB family C-S lyase [Bowmanella sp. JS7-9]TBX21285.1 aminotransferase class I/II [Bowmanella sp. JS7-9]